MDSLEINKIAGAILTAAVIAMVSGFIAQLIFSSGYDETEVAYAIETGEPAESAPVAEAPTLEPIGPLLASADVAAGIKVAKKCTNCHTFEQGGADRIGPNLYDIMGQNIAANPNYNYSRALDDKAAEVWDYENMNAFIAKPRDWAPGTKMSFAGIRKAGDRADLILYLRSLSGSPAALPEG